MSFVHYNILLFEVAHEKLNELHAIYAFNKDL